VLIVDWSPQWHIVQQAANLPETRCSEGETLKMKTIVCFLKSSQPKVQPMLEGMVLSVNTRSYIGGHLGVV
jgi:hypothetical protein